MVVRVVLDASAVPNKIAGAGRYVVELARRLPAINVDTTLVTRRADAERWSTLAPEAEVMNVVPDARVARLAYEGLLLGRSAATRGAQVWHSPHYTMPHRRELPTVVTIHDLTFFTNPEWHERAKVPFFQRAIRYAAQRATVLVSVSEFTKRQLDEFLPDHSPVVVAPHGVDLAQFSLEGDDVALFDAAQLPRGRRFVLFVGTVEPRKGLDVLLDAFQAVAADEPDLELWIAGQAGWGTSELDRALVDGPFASRIRRLGFVADSLLPALYRTATLVAYPSRGEGFGLPVLEALACGATVITTADTVMAEVAGDAATLVPVGDAAALAAAISTNLDQPRSREASRTRAQHFTWEHSLAQHHVAYQQAQA